MSSLINKTLKPLYFFFILIVSGLVLRNIIDLKLLYHNQQPIFFTDFETFRNAILVPGGLTGYLGSFFSELYYFPFLGLLATTGVIAIIPIAVYFKHSKNINQTFALIISASIWIIALLNFTDYSFKQSTLWVLIGALMFLYLLTYTIKKVNNTMLLMSLAFLMLIIDFMATGGPGLMLTCLLFLLNIINHKNLIFTKKLALFFISIAFAVLLPYLSVKTIFQTIPVNVAYFGEFINDIYYTNPNFIYILFSIIILPEILILILSRIKLAESKVANYLVCIIFIPLLYLLPYQLINKDVKKKVKIDYYAYEQKWDKVISEATTELLSEDYIIDFQVNRALYHTGNMLDNLCTVPQEFGAEALLIEHSINHRMLMPTSDIYYDMGLINGSRHWAYEAYTRFGIQPRILKRLVQTNIVNKKYNTAKKYILLLKKSIVNKNWALQQEEFLYNESKIEQNSEYSEKRNQLVTIDFFTNTTKPIENVRALLEQPNNHKMAFEYLISFYLLKHEVENVIKLIPDFRKFGYKKLPKLVQESVLLYIVKAQINSIESAGYAISQEIYKNLVEYSKLLKPLKLNDIKAKKTLDSKFLDTYWYYVQFNSPIAKNRKNN